MELTESPMSERQRKYRTTYRDRVAGWYNGWLHVLLIYTIGFTALYVYDTRYIRKDIRRAVRTPRVEMTKVAAE